MAFNLRPFGKVFETFMYGDICTVFRHGTETDPFGATKPSGPVEVPDLIDIACKFSFSEKDNPGDANGAYMPVLKQVVLFCSLDHDIKPGDKISGYRKDPESGIEQLVEGLCGLPNRFDTHQEIPIQVEGEN